MNRYLFVCLLVNVVDVPRVYLEGIAWLTRPGQITSTAHKNAVFNWTYSAVPHPVNIAWYYKGTNESPQLTYILGFSSRGIYVPNSAIDSRLEYERYPESATMVLRGVTFTDVGIYESKVSVLDEERVNDVPYITDSATLIVISEAALAFTVTIDDIPFEISVANNWTNVHLPNQEYSTVTLETELDISIQVNPSVPQPESIGIQIRSGSYIYSHHSCVGSHACERRVQIPQVHIVDQEADIVVTINFAIQNMDTVSIIQPIMFEASPGTIGTTETGMPCQSCAEDHSKRHAVAGCVVVICLLTVRLLVSCLWKIKKRRNASAVSRNRHRLQNMPTTDPQPNTDQPNTDQSQNITRLHVNAQAQQPSSSVESDTATTATPNAEPVRTTRSGRVVKPVNRLNL